MRHKRRPIKSKRHKSVTFIIDGQTSFYEQYEHNTHLNDVMRLAFLENNDISIDDCTNVTSILQRNIQQTLHHERRDQLQLKQQQQQQLQLQLKQQQLQLQIDQQQQEQQRQIQLHQQLQKHQLQLQLEQHHNHNHQQNHQQFQIPHHHQDDQPLYNDDDDEEVDAVDYHQQQSFDPVDYQPHLNHMMAEDYETEDDYDLSGSNRIFATATPTTSNNTAASASSTPRRPQPQSGSDLSFHLGVQSSKKRTRNSGSNRAEFTNNIKADTSIGKHDSGFLCDEAGCGKSFPSLRKLRHHKVVHSNVFPYVCEFQGCTKKFKRKFGIDLHSTTHFDLDPHMFCKTSNNSSLPYFGRRMQYSSCKPCNQKFKTVHEYQDHMVKHGKDPFKCPVKNCGQAFAIWKSFQKHRASHYFNYYCRMDPDCDHHTSNLQLLKLHIYCCHFRRKLPENATLTSKDQDNDEGEGEVVTQGERDVDFEADDSDLHLGAQGGGVKVEMGMDEQASENFDSENQSFQHDQEEEVANASLTMHEQEEPITPRKDSRLRKNPPRSSVRRDYAAISNGAGLLKSRR